MGLCLQLMHSMTWSNSTKIDSAWKRKVATDMLDSLSEYRYVEVYIHDLIYLRGAQLG